MKIFGLAKAVDKSSVAMICGLMVCVESVKMNAPTKPVVLVAWNLLLT